MEGNKQWWASKGVWGGLIALIAGVLTAFGVSIDSALQTEIVDTIVQIGGIVGAVLGIYGRIKATSKIGNG